MVGRRSPTHFGPLSGPRGSRSTFPLPIGDDGPGNLTVLGLEGGFSFFSVK
jgi:hypothetical protein